MKGMKREKNEIFNGEERESGWVWRLKQRNCQREETKSEGGSRLRSVRIDEGE